MTAGDYLKDRVDEAMERRMERIALRDEKPIDKEKYKIQLEIQKSFLLNFVSALQI